MMLLSAAVRGTIRSSVLSLLLSGTNELDNESDLLPDSRVCSSSDGLIYVLRLAAPSYKHESTCGST